MTNFSKADKPGHVTATCKRPLISVQVYFQKFPGVHGTDAERGIPDVDFKYTTASLSDKGKTATDGLVLMHIHQGEKQIKLEIFATTYQLTLVPTIPAFSVLKGVQWRLAMLGYEPGPPAGVGNKKTDFAMLQFEANNAPLDTIGLPNTSTNLPDVGPRTLLKTQAGV